LQLVGFACNNPRIQPEGLSFREYLPTPSESSAFNFQKNTLHGHLASSSSEKIIAFPGIPCSHNGAVNTLVRVNNKEVRGLVKNNLPDKLNNQSVMFALDAIFALTTKVIFWSAPFKS